MDIFLYAEGWGDALPDRVRSFRLLSFARQTLAWVVTPVLASLSSLLLVVVRGV